MTEMRRTLPALLLSLMMLTTAGLAVAQNNNTSDDEVSTADDVPDLVVEDLNYAPEDPEDGDSVRVFAEIANDGDNNASAFNVSLRLDGGTLVQERVDGLEEDEAYTLTAPPFQVEANETYNVSVVADSDDEVDEADEDNNEETVAIEVEASDEEDDDRDHESYRDDYRDKYENERSGDHDFERNHTSYEVDNGTYTGEHVAFSVDEEAPGVRNYTVLADDHTVFESIALEGELGEYHAIRHTFAMETNDSELMVRDVEELHVSAEAENGSVQWTVADGVEVSVYERYSDDENESDDDDTIYNLTLDNTTYHMAVENGTFEDGVLEAEDAMFRAEFPPAAMEDHREDEREERERGEEHREEHRSPFAGSQWERDNGTYTGDHVAFTVDENASAVQDYTLLANDTVVFDEIQLGGNDTRVRAHGQMFEMKTDDQRLRLLDTPSAIVVLDAEDEAPATMALADGVDAELVSEDEDGERVLYRLNLTGNQTAWLAGEELTLDDGTATVEDRAHHRALATNEGPRSLPDEAREAEGEDREDDERETEERGPPDERGQRAKAMPLESNAAAQVEQALARGNVSVEVHASSDANDTVALELGHVEVREAFADPDGETKAGMRIAAPHGSEGTTVTLNLDRAELGNLTVAEANEQLEVQFDNETIEPADDLKDVLDWKDEEEAEYLLLVGGDKVQVLVSVPHFSVHEIEVTSASTQSEETASETPGFGLAAAAGAVALAALARRTRQED